MLMITWIQRFLQWMLKQKNKQLAAEVTEKIASIGKVTKDSEAAIKEARAAYDSLTATEISCN